MANILHIERTANKITLGTTGTTINIASHTASKLLALDASKNLESITDLVVDTTNHRVGIGTATPSLKLDVKGSPNTTFTNCPLLMQVHTIDAYVDGMGGGISLGGRYDATRTTTFGYIAGVKDGVVEGDTAGKLILGARPTGGGGVDMMAITILGTGRVGIGTSSPNAPFEVKGLLPTDERIGGFWSGLLHVTNADSSPFANSVITGHNSLGGNTQLWYLGSVSGSNNDIVFINRQDAALSLRTNDIERLTITKDGDIGVDVTDPHSKLEVNGAISSATLTFSTVGPTDDVDVSGINTLFIDNSSNAVTIGGFAGGVDGQVLYIALINPGNNNVTLEHNHTGATQKIFLHAGADETLNLEYGGWVFVCHGGVDWHDCSHEKHV